MDPAIGQHCQDCGSNVPEYANYCPICGLLLMGGNARIKLPLGVLLITLLQCGSSAFSIMVGASDGSSGIAIAGALMLALGFLFFQGYSFARWVILFELPVLLFFTFTSFAILIYASAGFLSGMAAVAVILGIVTIVYLLTPGVSDYVTTLERKRLLKSERRIARMRN